VTTVDTIRAVFTYAIATIVVGGGMFVIYATRGEASSSDTVAIIAGFVGAALSFVFSTEVQTRTARQTTTAHVEGAATHANGIGERERDRSAQAADELSARG
jgi:NAD/NADP transhydrogenase beta subunit